MNDRNVNQIGNFRIGQMTDVVTGVPAPIAYLRKSGQYPGGILVTVKVGGNLVSEVVFGS